MKIIKYFLFLLLSIVLFESCTDDKCNSETESLVTAGLNIKDQTLTDANYLKNLSVYSPEWVDSVHYTTSENPSISFMLSPMSDTSIIIFTSETVSPNDTVFFYSLRKYIFVSPECGFSTNFYIDSVKHTYNHIDSIKITKPETLVEQNGQVEIYF